MGIINFSYKNLGYQLGMSFILLSYFMKNVEAVRAMLSFGFIILLISEYIYTGHVLIDTLIWNLMLVFINMHRVINDYLEA